MLYSKPHIFIGGLMMRKVDLRMNELKKYEIIKKLVETNGNKKRAAIKLGCSLRTVNRLILKYKKDGKAAFVHGNRGRCPSTTFPLDVKNLIVSSYINDYSDTNFIHFCEIVKEDFGINISDTTLNKWHVVRAGHFLRRLTKLQFRNGCLQLNNINFFETLDIALFFCQFFCIFYSYFLVLCDIIVSGGVSYG